MTPEQRFARWVRAAIVLFVVIFVYFVFADTYMPATPQSRALRQVVRVAPQVSGQVVAVPISNNARVRRGEVLFRIDPEPFELAVEKAQLALDQARRDNAGLDASLAEAQATLSRQRALTAELSRERNRMQSLLERGSVSRQRFESINADADAGKAAVKAAEAKVNALQVQRGKAGKDNLQLRQARNALAAARLDLRRATVHAEQSGHISNLQLNVGDSVSSGAPVMANVGDRLDIVADFREKSLRHVGAGDRAWIAFDALPGEEYPARVTSIDAGVRDGQLLPDGNLAHIPTTDRWVRDAQRIRVHLRLDEPPESLPPTGARATVQLAPVDNPVAHGLARAQVALLSMLHHVY
ncbi:MAG: HlyD family secretion protein [Halomonas sp.]|nr:HlyD family secretion protein [Halomonas sp.]MDN6296895.1 HlyD family secretion protein [Halomonas sp.]MDN6314387.1 HlyD family secretion protein [Halomonas sp.]MDN6335653.1 HlyD family secretion protein [Halomonas sp.]